MTGIRTRKGLALLLQMPASRTLTALAIGLVTACISSPSVGATRISTAAQLADLSLEQLSNVQITSVTRRAQRLSDAAGSVYVITGDEIRRSGATSLPQALRLAPNLHVARADANQWAISARGFNSTTANKMLTLIDGRTVYSPLFSGVFWEAQGVMLEDIDRIEVMSGSGGTLWGSNAVNGFINIITRSAADTQGTLATIGLGSHDALANSRHGGALANGGHYRVYGQATRRSHTSNAAGTAIRDGSHKAQGGFRTDWGDSANNVTVQGDLYSSSIDQVLSERRISGLNLMGRLERQLSPESTLRVQAYYDRTERDQPGAIRDELDTIDMEFQHGFKLAQRHRLLWGGGYRRQFDRLTNVGAGLAFIPGNRTLSLSNLFVQDQIELSQDLELTLGMKLEHNDYTGLEHLPNARLSWKPATGHLLWGAASRTVRIPSRLDRELFAPAAPPHTLLAGGPNFRSEISRVYELGYRAQPTPVLSYSVTVFHHDFDRQRSIEASPAGPVIDNQIEGSSTGIEAWGKYRLSSTWRINAGFMHQNLNLRLKPGSTSTTGVANLGNDPRFTWVLGSSIDLRPGLELDLMARRVGGLPSPAVPAYTALDARLGWRVRDDLEFSITAQNLLDARHPEWGAAPGRAQFERGILLKMLWRRR